VDATYPRSVATWWLGCPNQGEMTDVRNPYVQDQIEQSEKNNKDEQWIVVKDQIEQSETNYKDEQWIVVEDDGMVYSDQEKQYNSSSTNNSSFKVSLIPALLTFLYIFVFRI